MEIDVVNEYLSVLSNNWIIQREVEGYSFTNKLRRIDAVIVSKEQPHIKFGIEFKRVDLGSMTNFTAWIKQAIIYSQCTWNGYGKLPILIAPSFNYGVESETMLAKRILGEFGIGEIHKYYNAHFKKSIYQINHKTVRLWCTQYGFNKITLKMNFQQYLEL